MPETEYRACPPRRYRWDGAYPEIDLLYEVQGGIWMRKGGHNTGTGISRDCEKNNLAVTRGWRVLYFTRAMVESGDAMAMLQQELGRGMDGGV
jgi:hypothetical protein